MKYAKRVLLAVLFIGGFVVILLTDAVAPVMEPMEMMTTMTTIVLSSAPTVSPNTVPDTAPTAVPTAAPEAAPTVSPTATAASNFFTGELPLELGKKTQSFPINVIPVGSVYINTYEEKPKPTISILMARKNGKWLDETECYFGNPPIPAMDYIEAINEKYNWEEQPDPYETPNYDPNDFFLESEILHRDMTFYIYDGSTYLGSGHIAKKPELVTYYHEVFISAEFKMDDPTIVLSDEKGYAAQTGQWNPYPTNVEWNRAGDEFKIDLGGKGIITGKVKEKPNEEYPDQLVPYIEIRYRGKTYALSDYDEEIYCRDYDGDGISEISSESSSDGGWSRTIYSLKSGKPKILIEQGGRY